MSPRRVALPYGRLSWPYPTLWRYHAIASYADVFRAHEVTHLVYTDVDMRVIHEVPELFGPSLVAVRHPGYVDQTWTDLPFCADRASTAYFAPSASSRYVCGGVQGGETERYLAAVEHLRGNILDDFRGGVMATWHDESHWNRYVDSCDDGEIIVLGSEFCWPESTPGASPAPKILALDKDHHALRGTRPSFRARVSAVPGARRAVRLARRAVARRRPRSTVGSP